MAMAEIPLEGLSRRDFLSGRRRRSGGQPPRRPDARSPYPSPQPPNWGKMLTRRELLIGAGAVVGGGTLGAILKPWERITQEDQENTESILTPTPTSTEAKERFTTPELEKLGQELREWQLQDGRKMSDLYTEVLLTADLLQGNLDPKTVLPYFKGPITLSSDTQIGQLDLPNKMDLVDLRKIGIYRGGTLLAYSNWLKDMSINLKLGTDIQSSEARLYIIVKEVS